MMNHIKFSKKILEHFEQQDKALRVLLIFNNLQSRDNNADDLPTISCCGVVSHYLQNELPVISALDDLCWANAFYFYFQHLYYNPNPNSLKLQKYYESYCLSKDFESIKNEVLEIHNHNLEDDIYGEEDFYYNDFSKSSENNLETEEELIQALYPTKLF